MKALSYKNFVTRVRSLLSCAGLSATLILLAAGCSGPNRTLIAAASAPAGFRETGEQNFPDAHEQAERRAQALERDGGFLDAGGRRFEFSGQEFTLGEIAQEPGGWSMYFEPLETHPKEYETLILYSESEVDGSASSFASYVQDYYTREGPGRKAYLQHIPGPADGIGLIILYENTPQNKNEFSIRVYEDEEDGRVGITAYMIRADVSDPDFLEYCRTNTDRWLTEAGQLELDEINPFPSIGAGDSVFTTPGDTFPGRPTSSPSSNFDPEESPATIPAESPAPRTPRESLEQDMNNFIPLSPQPNIENENIDR